MLDLSLLFNNYYVCCLLCLYLFLSGLNSYCLTLASVSRVVPLGLFGRPTDKADYNISLKFL